MLAHETCRAGTDHKRAYGRGLYLDLGIMVVVFQIPLRGTARHGKAERGLPAHAGGAGAAVYEKRSQVQHGVEA